MTTTEPIYWCVWNRQGTPNHEIWRGDLANGAEDVPVELAAASAVSYAAPYGTIYPTVRQMVTGPQHELYVLWMDAEVRLDGGARPEAEQPGKRIGDTARLIRYDGDDGTLQWTADLAAAIRTYEAGATTVVICEHGAIATSNAGTVGVALAGYTITAGVYQRYLWMIRVNADDGAIEETFHVSTRDAAAEVDATHDVGLCQVFGATWTPDGKFWAASDYKYRDNGATAYDPHEFSGRLYRFDEDDLTVCVAVEIDLPDGSPAVPVGVSYSGAGYLVLPVFQLRNEGLATEETTGGVVICGLDGGILAYGTARIEADGAAPVYESWPHAGGMCGMERQSARLETAELNNQVWGINSGAMRCGLVWVTDGKKLWRFDPDGGVLEPRVLGAGGDDSRNSQGTDRTYGRHALARRASGEILYLTYEYVELSATDLLMRLSCCSQSGGQRLFGSYMHFESADPVLTPYIPQPYYWNGGPDGAGNPTEIGKAEFPWAVLAVSAPKARSR